MNDSKSVITRYRSIMLTKITSGAIATMPPVTQIAFGDGGVDAGGEPLTPVDTQTTLRHEVGRYALDSVSYPEETTARYSATIPEGHLAGASISEMALVDGDGKLCAVKNMYIKRKDAEVKFTFTFDDCFQ